MEGVDDEVKYYTQDNVYIMQCAVDEIAIEIVDKAKTSIGEKNYVNAGFFGLYAKNGQQFTMPVGFIAADINCGSLPKEYFPSWGTVKNNKFYFNSYNFTQAQFYKKAMTCLIIENGKARIEDISSMNTNYQYCLAGVPIMKGGNDVIWTTYVKNQGWYGSELYATRHIFVGLKIGDPHVYIMGWKSSTGNMISSAEAYKKFKALGFSDVIKLDGGGSYHYVYDGKAKDTTSENRRINSIIKITNKHIDATNPYTMPSIAVQYGCTNVNAVKWMQWELNNHGFDCGNIDGSFGPATLKALKSFQAAHNLAVDGSCGPATKAVLKS